MTNQCESCKYNASEGCGVNPGLWRSRCVMARSSQLDREALESQLPGDCADFEARPRVRLELEAGEDEWNLILGLLKASMNAAKFVDLARQIREQLGSNDEEKGDRSGFMPLPLGVTVATFGDPVVRRSEMVSEPLLRHPCHLGPSGMSTGYTLRITDEDGIDLDDDDEDDNEENEP